MLSPVLLSYIFVYVALYIAIPRSRGVTLPMVASAVFIIVVEYAAPVGVWEYPYGYRWFLLNFVVDLLVIRRLWNECSALAWCVAGLLWLSALCNLLVLIEWPFILQSQVLFKAFRPAMLVINSLILIVGLWHGTASIISSACERYHNNPVGTPRSKALRLENKK